MTSTTYAASNASGHRLDYHPEWLDKLADDATIPSSVLTRILGFQLIGEDFARTPCAHHFLSHNAAEAFSEGTTAR